MKKIEFENIDFSYNGGSEIFSNLTCCLSNDIEGKIIGIMGESGCGKSTFLKLVLNILKPQNGEIITTPQTPVFAYLPQEPVLFEHLSPKGNATYFKNTKHYRKRFNIKIYDELKETLGLTDVLTNSKSVLKLSGGQKQRIALLQALSIQPDFLLLDEPTTGLDTDVKIQFLNKLRLLTDKYKLLVLYVTHNKTEAELVTDDIVYLRRNGSNKIESVFQNKTKLFSKKPPILEAGTVFKYPNPNIIDIDCFNFVHKTIYSGENIKALISEENIIFDENEGFEFAELKSNDVYSLIELKGLKFRLMLRCDKITKSKIKFIGNIPIYKDGEMISEIAI